MSGICKIVLFTPPGRGAVATLLVAGRDAAEVVSRRFHSANRRVANFSQMPLKKIAFGRFGDDPGEEIVVCRIAEGRVELHCHGGRAAAERVIALLSAEGCQPSEWSEWIETAEPDLLRQEAATALTRAPTQRTANILLDQYQGALRREIEAIVAAVSGQAERLNALFGLANFGLHLTQPWQVVVAGRPNVGKSSLVNALLGYRRAIVFDQPGTTRDVVTAATALDGWPVELADTAGLRESADPLEQAGVTLARGQLEKADCALLVVDGSQPWSEAEATLSDALPDAILVHNKADLGIVEPRPRGLVVSATAGIGLAELMTAVVAKLVPQTPSPGAAVPFAIRQVDALQSAKSAADRGDVSAVREALREFLGEDFNSPARQ